MKGYEFKTGENPVLAPGQPWIARVDGHKFSTFTRGLRRPFDPRLHRAMCLTTANLVDHFGATTGYTQSDEITLVFPAAVDPQTPRNAGRVVKLASLLAGYASVRFAYHIARAMDAVAMDKCDMVWCGRKLADPHMYFDARLSNLPDESEVLNNILWRSVHDCQRNSVHGLGSCHFSHKQLQGVNMRDLRGRLRDEKDVDWADQPPAFRFGSFAKKQSYTIRARNPKTGLEEDATRTRLLVIPFNLGTFSEAHCEMLFAKQWPEAYSALHADCSWIVP